MFDNLTNDNILLYAMKHYSNPACHSVAEFNEDFDKIKYVKRLFKRYQLKGVLKERLILNHITIIYNVFGPEVATRILYFRLEDDLWPILKTCLVVLNYQNDVVFGIDGRDIKAADIPIDEALAERLRIM